MNNRTAWINRGKFLALVAVFVLPALAAALWFFLAPMLAPAATANGELIHPARPLDAFSARTVEGAAFARENLDGLWHVVHVIDSTCGKGCRERIYYTRQIRDALGHERLRVRRLLVGTGDDTTSRLEAFLEDHPDMVVLADGTADALVAQMPDDRDGETVFLVDPFGNLMMRFDADVAPGDILDDIKKLLRVSRIG